MWSLLLPLLSQLPGLFGDFFKQKNAIESAKLEVQRQIEIAKLDLVKEIAVAQLNLNATIVGSTSSFCLPKSGLSSQTASASDITISSCSPLGAL